MDAGLVEATSKDQNQTHTHTHTLTDRRFSTFLSFEIKSPKLQQMFEGYIFDFLAKRQTYRTFLGTRGGESWSEKGLIFKILNFEASVTKLATNILGLIKRLFTKKALFNTLTPCC